MKKILITGATGHFGKATIEFLLKKGISASNISALVRDKAKASELDKLGIALKVGDYDNYSSLLEAFKGVDKLLLVSGNDVVNRTKQQENAVKAAKEAGVKHVVYTSFQRNNESATSPIALVAEAHIKTEKWLKESGLSYTIMKNSLYMDLLPIYVGEKVLETGIIYQPAGEGKTAFLLRSDMAEVAAHILITEGHENKEYDITAESAWSYNDVAKYISEITGKYIQYVSPSQEEFAKTLTQAGVPTDAIAFLASFAEAIKQGEFAYTNTTIEKLIGRKPVSMHDYLKEVYANS